MTPALSDRQKSLLRMALHEQVIRLSNRVLDLTDRKLTIAYNLWQQKQELEGNTFIALFDYDINKSQTMKDEFNELMDILL